METRSERAARLAAAQQEWEANRHKTGVACDECKTELINPTPDLVLSSYPAQINVECPGCGWRGYMRA